MLPWCNGQHETLRICFSEGSNRERGTSKITTKEDFIKTFLKYKTFSAVAKEYDCCDKNIAKLAKKFGLPSKSKEMKKYLQELETKMGS